MNYTVHPVAPALAAIVECLWTLEGDAAELGGAVQSILPDGRPEIVLHFGEAFNRLDRDGGLERQAPLLFAGQLQGELQLQPTGHIGVLGIRLHPDAARALVAPPLVELTGLTIGIDAVAPALARALGEVRDLTSSPVEAIPAVEQRLLAHVDPARLDPVVRFAVRGIARQAGAVSIERLASDAGITRRHLERRFQALVGLSPKRLARVTRLQRAVRMLEALDVPNPGARTAAACGYADQAHFARDCRDLFGSAPAAWLERRALLTEFFLARPHGA